MGKTQKWAVAALAAVAMGGAFTAIAADNNAVANHGHGAAYGSAAVVAGKTYKLADMLTYAIEDEYAARAEYAAIMAKFGEQRPFSNIMRAEQTHIARLTPLFAAHGVALPKDNAAQHVLVPATLAEAFKIGVDAEVKNIAMYEAFLRAELPADVRLVFEALKNASKNHLAAFENGVKRGTGADSGAGFGAGNGNGAGAGQGGAGRGRQR